MKKDLETCLNKYESDQAVRKISPLAVKDVIRYDKLGCYRCDGRDKTCEFYQK